MTRRDASQFLYLFLLLSAMGLELSSCSNKPVPNLAVSQTQSLHPFPTTPSPTLETSEMKARRIAEEFIVRNGYTDLPPDKNHLSYETVEMADSLDQLLQWRHDTLEPKPYGLCYNGRMGTKGGWTFVFRSKGQATEKNLPLGRAVTMNSKFEDLLVEHKDFPLPNADKRFD